MSDTRYDLALDEVKNRIAAGESFWELENAIDDFKELNDDQRSALWLLALASENSPCTRRFSRLLGGRKLIVNQGFEIASYRPLRGD